MLHLDIQADSLLGEDQLEPAVRKPLAEKLGERMRGLGPLKPHDLELVRTIAQALSTDEWVSGKRLRHQWKVTDIERFRLRVSRLVPRYIRVEDSTRDDFYSLTLPGLFASGDTAALDLLQKLLVAIRHRYESNPDSQHYDWEDLQMAGVSPSDVRLAYHVASIALLVSGGTMANGGVKPSIRLGMPPDVEKMLTALRSMTFEEYVIAAANDPPNGDKWHIERPYLYAPLTLEDDGDQLNYVNDNGVRRIRRSSFAYDIHEITTAASNTAESLATKAALAPLSYIQSLDSPQSEERHVAHDQLKDFDKAPEIYWHCYFGEEEQSPTAWAKQRDLSKGDLIRTVLLPWHQGKRFFVGGKSIRKSDKITAAKIVQTPQSSHVYEDARSERLGASGILTFAGIGFAAFHEGADYTNELLSEDSTFARSARLEMEHQMSKEPAGDPQRVFIIHGRNSELLEEFRGWLQSLGLFARSFDEIRTDLGGSPSILDVIRRGISEAHAIIALITPDEFATLRPELRGGRDKSAEIQRWQARPNVIFEAGMAFAMTGEMRTLLLVAGDAELFSDVSSIHYKRIPKDATEREQLRKILVSMGCKIHDASDHHRRGNFDAGPLRALSVQVSFLEPDAAMGDRKKDPTTKRPPGHRKRGRPFK
jgi:predicted nucleotide-binding protein